MRTLASFVLCLLLVASGSAEAAVQLRTEVEVDRAAIRLGDVFTGLPEGLDRDIATAPLPGRSVTYDGAVLSKLAQDYRLDWPSQGMGDRCVLTRASTVISTDKIVAAIQEKVKDSLENAKDSKLEIVLDQRGLEVYLPKSQSATFRLARFTFDADSKRFRADLVASGATQPVSGRVSMKRDVPVLARRLDGGTVLSETDLDWITIPADHLPGDLITSASDLVGRELRRETADSIPLRTRDIMQPRLVNRGSLVTMRITTPYMQVTAQGRAMQDGSKGDVVRVTNTQSNRIVEGTVVATGVIQIHVPENMALAQTGDQPLHP